MELDNIDDEWKYFIANNKNTRESSFDEDTDDSKKDEFNDTIEKLNSTTVPEPTDIYISTKSKIAYLTQPVDLKIFWDIPVISYSTPQNGVIKKQIKINSKTPEELEFVQQRLSDELYCEQHIISHIDNPSGRIKFKDIRKVTIGISKKDITRYRSKKKQAFYNCFVMILRIKIDDIFREFHIKVFNTGKLEMPGVQSENMFNIVLSYILQILRPFYSTELTCSEKSDIVLINSNFNCGFYINRESLYDILRNKYNIRCSYDPCSYPGIQCKFRYTPRMFEKSGQETTLIEADTPTPNKSHMDLSYVDISYMIFRTGSVLIVGMCDENVLHHIYKFLTNILKEEFKFICQKLIDPSELQNKEKKKKMRKKTIYLPEITLADQN
jgi:TATA-box binding protein (TBP) (component of TFIID and TFIIIB)